MKIKLILVGPNFVRIVKNCISVNKLINYKCLQLIPAFHETYPSATSPSVHSLGPTYLRPAVEERRVARGGCNLYLFLQTMHVFLKFLRYLVSAQNYKCCSRRVRGSCFKFNS